jgi:transposase InsO family protein
MFVVATASFRILYALIVLRHDRVRVIHFDVTQNPTQAWLSRQMTEVLSLGHRGPLSAARSGPSYGRTFRDRVRVTRIKDVVTAPRSPWQNGFSERLIGTVRRECVDHVIVFGEAHLRRSVSGAAGCYRSAAPPPSRISWVGPRSPVRLHRVGRVAVSPW